MRTNDRRRMRQCPGHSPATSPFRARAAALAAAVVASATLIATLAFSARAGQIRINVSSNFFADSTEVANPGDQIVWVWTAGTHTVTSGTNGSTGGDGTFNSNSQSGANRAFAWKSPGAASGVQRYYCFPHFGLGMHGRINFSASHVPVSDFRITEVRFSTLHDSDFVEITNLGDAAGNLGRYRLSAPSATQLVLGGTLPDIAVPIGGRVVAWLGRSGTNSATEQFFPGATLPRTGSAALYLATTKAADTTLARADLMVDFVQWGAAAQINEATAATAGFWTAGEFAPAVADGHTLEFCGTAADRGLASWNGSPVATPGSANCVTPVLSSSWGRIKAIYR